MKVGAFDTVLAKQRVVLGPQAASEPDFEGANTTRSKHEEDVSYASKILDSIQVTAKIFLEVCKSSCEQKKFVKGRIGMAQRQQNIP